MVLITHLEKIMITKKSKPIKNINFINKLFNKNIYNFIHK